MFKCIYSKDIMPIEIYNKQISSFSHRYGTRGSENHLIYRDRSSQSKSNVVIYSNNVISHWNNLSVSIRSCSHYNKFMSNCISYLKHLSC